MYPGHKILLRKKTPVVHGLPEPFDVLLPHGKPCRHGMTAKLGKKAGGSRHGLVHVISLYGAAGSLDPLLAPGEDKDRMIVSLPDPPRDNTRQTFMHLGQKNQHHLILLHVMLRNIFLRLLHPLQGQILPAVVQLLQLPGRGHGLRQRTALQKLQRPSGRIQTSGGVETGADDKAQVMGAQLFRLQPVHLHQRSQAWIPGSAQALQPLFHQNPVLIPQLHHIADRGEGGKLQKLFQRLRKLPVPRFLRQRRDQLIGHHAAADSGKRIIALLLLRIHHRQPGRQKLPPHPASLRLFRPEGNLMVIRNHHVNAQTARQLDLRRSGNAVVTGDDKTHPVLTGLPDQMLVEPVAVVDAVGNRRVRRSPQQPKPSGQNIGGTDSVHIIVSDDPDVRPPPYRCQNRLHRFVHIL